MSPFRRCPFWEQELANKYSCKLVGLCPKGCVVLISVPSYFLCDVVIARGTASFLSDLGGPAFLLGLKIKVCPQSCYQPPPPPTGLLSFLF